MVFHRSVRPALNGRIGELLNKWGFPIANAVGKSEAFGVTNLVRLIGGREGTEKGFPVLNWARVDSRKTTIRR